MSNSAHIVLVPGAGVEPARLIQTQDFKSRASTNSATPALAVILAHPPATVHEFPTSARHRKSPGNSWTIAQELCPGGAPVLVAMLFRHSYACQ